ncbi:DUF4296 domain-containing protein [Flagellimonas meridianipacifica]|uniref:Uncharacterized protein DUF4296 n=1 Tax=Flagellimonas meridianipacifica TaxID=1080225 RepID=A0A2T0MG32_9FLAO|nr:DUF4296 domain-containing protein [Allomuricauda pacifica]PRX56533.1 uncharacterized protein DUF4296 [Allomuricauda pacifica]
MTKRTVLAFVLVLAVWSCAEKVVEPPEDLISEEKMVDILHDLALLRAAKTSFNYYLEDNSVETMDFLYKKYQIDSIQFVQSDKYYASIPLRYQMIYEKVEARLEAKRKVLEEDSQKRNDSTRAAQQNRADSLNKVRKEAKPSS